MSIDIFELNKKYFVNEIQASFGNTKPENIYLGKEYMGRYIYNYKKIIGYPKKEISIKMPVQIYELNIC